MSAAGVAMFVVQSADHAGVESHARRIPVSIVRTVQFGPAEPYFSSLCCIYRGNEQSQRSALLWPLGKKQWNMTHITISLLSG
jgi:hypothetical protein